MAGQIACSALPVYMQLHQRLLSPCERPAEPSQPPAASLNGAARYQQLYEAQDAREQFLWLSKFNLK